VTAEDFRRLVLAMPGATESAHMGHPDFRAANRIFATLGAPDARYAMVKLDPVQQEMLVAAEPAIFAPVSGGWGRRAALWFSWSVPIRIPRAAPSKWPGATSRSKRPQGPGSQESVSDSQPNR
jgi:hypothetical protein